jgi:hypothetical protein
MLLILIVSILFLSAHSLIAAPNRRVLVYFFKDITGEEEYTELNYQIPVYFFSRINDQVEGKKFVLIDSEGLDVYRKDKTRNLWNEDVLLNIAKKKNFDDIIYGIFYVQNGKPVIMGKIFHAKSGLILDIKEGETDYYDILREIEEIDIDQIAAHEKEFEVKTFEGYNPKLSRIVQSEVRDTWFFIQNSAGPYFPLGNWADLYPPGFYYELTYVYFPKMNIARLGIGFNANLIEMTRIGSATLVDSSITVLSTGVSIQYSIKLGHVFETILLDLNVGIAQSYMIQNNYRSESSDLYLKGGVNLVINPFGNFHLSLKAGVFSIDYKENPMDALFIEIGRIRF